VFHGNNKSSSEISNALTAAVGTIVVDSFDEMDRIDALVSAGVGPVPEILIRVNPGIQAHTHEYLQTGIPDSKFGFPIADGTASAAIERARASASMVYRGVHVHIGSQVFDVESYRKAIVALAPFVDGSGADEFSVGGGLGVAYVEGESESSISDWASMVTSAVADAGITARVTAEPGRAIVAKAALTAYTVGTIKQVPEVRTYLAVDGGMSDNPRPVLYGSGYEAFLARSVLSERGAQFRIVGKHCESGDVIVKDAYLPLDVVVGDVICTPVTGAYGHAMGSNYNKVLRPAAVFVKNGNARVVVRRETLEDLLTTDMG
jgi:diaminopimelate decarboxylase